MERGVLLARDAAGRLTTPPATHLFPRSQCLLAEELAETGKTFEALQILAVLKDNLERLDKNSLLLVMKVAAKIGPSELMWACGELMLSDPENSGRLLFNIGKLAANSDTSNPDVICECLMRLGRSVEGAYQGCRIIGDWLPENRLTIIRHLALLDNSPMLASGLEDQPLQRLGLPERIVNRLEDAGAHSLSELFKLGRNSVRAIYGIGEKSMAEIDRAVTALGLNLPD
jgi:hypothetical protein